jgi:Ca-activated chloride channel homolog
MIKYVAQQFEDLILWVLRLIWPNADQFRSGVFLLLLLVVPAYLLWYYWWYDRRRLIVQLSYDPKKIAPKRFNWAFLRVIPQILNILAFVLMVTALARPITSRDIDQRYSEGIDIMMVLDVSGSMETLDLSPRDSRLEIAKETAVKFINGRSYDRIGMVVFAEDALSYAPLTLDYSLLKQQIESINSDMMPKEGTAMGSAISVGINRLKESTTPSKIMILITDGASNRGQIDPVTAAELAKRHKIKIYTIGVGKKEFQQSSMFGSQTVKSDLDEPTMEKIAEITGGKFFRSTDKKGMGTIFDNISKMEKVEIQETHYREENDLYGPILMVAVILFGLNLLLMVTFVHNPLEG